MMIYPDAPDESNLNEAEESPVSDILDGMAQECQAVDHSVPYGEGSLVRRVSGAPNWEVPELTSFPSLKESRRGWIYPTPQIEWDEMKGYRLYLRVRDYFNAGQLDDWGYIDRAVQDDLLDVAEPERSALHSFMVNLWAYSWAGPKLTLGYFDIMSRSLLEGPAFAKWLDGFKTYQLVLGVGDSVPFSNEIEETYKQWPKEKKLTVGDMYRANMLFPWAPPKPDVVEITSKPVEQDPEIISLFREKARAWCQHPLRQIITLRPDEMSGNRESTRKAQEGKQFLQDPKPPGSRRDRSRIAYIPRELKESRAACVETVASLSSVRLIDATVRRVLSTDKRSKMDVHGATLKNEMERKLTGRPAGTQKKFYRSPTPRGAYCRDFKKEGLTKPRNLIRIMLEELKAAYPWCAAFRNPGFFDEWEFTITGDEEMIFYPPRGHGLGMCNALTTLMQLIIEDIVKDKVWVHDRPIWSGYNNDDAAMIFNNTTQAISYSKVDREVCRALSLDFKDKSTFISTQFIVLCEVYAGPPKMNERGTFGFMTVGNLLKAINASHARELAASMSARVKTQFLEEVGRYWGTILYRNEQQRGRLIGGWFPVSQHGIDIQFADRRSWEEVPQNEWAAFKAYRAVEVQYQPWLKGKKFHALRYKLYPAKWLEQRNEPEWKQYPFRPQDDVKTHVRAWQKFEELLKKIFRRFCSIWEKTKNRQTWGELYEEYCAEHPEWDIYPPLGYKSKPVKYGTFTRTTEFHHPYDGFPDQVDLNLYIADQRNIYPRRMGVQGSRNLHWFKMTRATDDVETGFMPKSTKIFQTPETTFHEASDSFLLMPSEENMRQWHDPFAVVAVARGLRQHPPLVPPVPEKQELLSLRKEFFGTELTPEEWILVGQIHPDDRIIIYLTAPNWRSDFRFTETGIRLSLFNIVKLLKKYPGSGRYLDQGEVSMEKALVFFSIWASVLIELREDIKARRAGEREQMQIAIDELIETGDTEEVVRTIGYLPHKMTRTHGEFRKMDILDPLTGLPEGWDEGKPDIPEYEEIFDPWDNPPEEKIPPEEDNSGYELPEVEFVEVNSYGELEGGFEDEDPFDPF
jgi:hypothetical protein